MPVRLVRPARRSPAPRRPGRAARPLAAVLAVAVLSGLCGCGSGGHASAGHRAGAVGAASAAAGPTEDQADKRPGAAPLAAPAAGEPAARVASGPLEAGGSLVRRQLPDLGPATLAEIPANALQVVVVTGRDADSPRSRLVAYRHTEAGWVTDGGWKARNARDGWTKEHYDDDLRSPIGVYGLTDAGGRMPDPGTRLPYDESPDFATGGRGFEGESLAHSFDYVVAINYNRVRGVSPLDKERPWGEARGGGIWFHVDHGGPTHGCVSMSEDHIKELLRILDPELHPVVVMGDGASLAR
ncbi:L,D-transpeptidase family protein [Streptomyces sp. NBC_01497]|uniref:L,D-transpeptidase family protein n=1 Tax=Streptomyces sp. NBC_01497 TaxID=2903885 RepID=UPI002E2FF44A|nr:L,D-transpeptidase family protein [Streptomyces sp. NBC_01497]